MGIYTYDPNNHASRKTLHDNWGDPVKRNLIKAVEQYDSTKPAITPAIDPALPAGVFIRKRNEVTVMPKGKIISFYGMCTDDYCDTMTSASGQWADWSPSSNGPSYHLPSGEALPTASEETSFTTYDADFTSYATMDMTDGYQYFPKETFAIMTYCNGGVNTSFSLIGALPDVKLTTPCQLTSYIS